MQISSLYPIAEGLRKLWFGLTGDCLVSIKMGDIWFGVELSVKQSELTSCKSYRE